MAYRGVKIELAIQAIENDYTAIGSIMTHGKQDGYCIIEYVLRILRMHQKKAVANRKKEKIQSAANTLDS